MNPPPLLLVGLDAYLFGAGAWVGGFAKRGLLKERPPDRERASASATLSPMPSTEKKKKERKTAINFLQ